jgi:putative methyltransferase (TIGR04325 family)
MKEFLKEVLPPAVIKRLKISSKHGWFGNYTSWNIAKDKCVGYDSKIILEKVKEATLKVKEGKAVYERDSVIFNSIEYSWPLLSSLMWVSALNGGRLSVLDFGGSLGSSYFQNLTYLKTLETVNWNIVEQEAFVRCGRDHIQDEHLQFFYTIDEMIKTNGKPDVLVMSCVLPYLEKPYEVLETLMNYRIPYLIIDNTYFNFESLDRICVQKVPPVIYEASYPCWFLNYDNVVETICQQYSIISEHENKSVIQLDRTDIQYKGFTAKLKEEK